MEYIEVPSSQIPPITGFEVPVPLKKIIDDANEFFYKQGILPYKIYKNAIASSTGVSRNSKEFVENLFNILEDSLKIQLKEKDITTPERVVAVREAFSVIKSMFKVLESADVRYDAVTFYGAVVGYILGKLR